MAPSRPPGDDRSTLFLDDVTDPGTPPEPPTSESPPDPHGPRTTLYFDEHTDPGDPPEPPTGEPEPDPHGPRSTLYFDDATDPGGPPSTLFLDGMGVAEDVPVAPTPPRSADRYEALGLLGQGGVGRVSLVFDRELKREVAMKTLLSQRGAPHFPELHRRFIEEARATGQLEHPNIVPIHDIGEDADGNAYFTMKRIRGVSLAEVLKAIRDDTPAGEDRQSARTLYTQRRLVEILVDICQGVAFAHSHRVLHRDLKPANVMLGPFGEVLVADWGLAKVLGASEEAVGPAVAPVHTSGNHTLVGQIRGTPSYMSPEQAGGAVDKLDERTDVYALGGILFAMLSGQSPHGELSVQATLEAVTSGKPATLDTDLPGFGPIPRELRAICDKAMAHGIDDRYASVEAMRTDLQAYLDHRSVDALHDGVLRRLSKWLFRHRVLVGATTGTAALVVLLGGLGWVVDRARTIDGLLDQADQSFEKAHADYQDLKSRADNVAEDDPYREQLLALARGNLSQVYRSKLNLVADPLKQVLELDPDHAGGRERLARVYMELWRLALADDNAQLMEHLRRSVEEYAPAPELYRAELDGLGQIQLALSPADASAWLFRYETLHATSPDGHALAARRVPVPFDPGSHKVDRGFLKREAKRIKAGEDFEHTRASVHPIDTRPELKLTAGDHTVEQVPPGSYLLLVQAPGHAEVRVPVFVERQATATVTVSPPRADAVPEGFVPVLGGTAIVGGETAGAVSRQARSIAPFLMARLEVTMAEYADFLAHLAGSGDRETAEAHLPRDFGRLLATLDADHQLVPTDSAQDPAAFLASPVRGVSLNDAEAYIAWRSAQDGRAYRLPDDWGWEAACRGADGRLFSWGDQPGVGLALVSQGYGDSGANMSWDWADHFDESPWGIHNLAGGVAEWTASPYSPDAVEGDPVHGQHTIRGNAWSIPPVGLECDFRTSGQPDYFHPTIGFRLALDYPTGLSEG